MSYGASSDLIDRFGFREAWQVAPGPDPETVDENRIDQALADASAQIDGYLRPRYRLPLSTTPALLVGLTCDIARFRLQHGDGRLPADQAQSAYDRAISFLRDVSSGKADLGVDQSGQAPKRGGGPRATTGGPSLGDGTLREFEGN